MNINDDFSNLFNDIPDSAWDESDSQDFTGETLKLADDNLVNNFAVLDELKPPAPVFLNNPNTLGHFHFWTMVNYKVNSISFITFWFNFNRFGLFDKLFWTKVK